MRYDQQEAGNSQTMVDGMIRLSTVAVDNLKYTVDITLPNLPVSEARLAGTFGLQRSRTFNRLRSNDARNVDSNQMQPKK